MILRRCLLAFAGLLLSSSLSSATFSYNTVPLWADFGSNAYPGNDCNNQTANCLLSDEQAAFVASKYQVISLEKCFGISHGPGSDGKLTEDNFHFTAHQIKSFNASTQVLFYWHTSLVVAGCYDAAKEFLAHPEWFMRTDAGVPVNTSSNPIVDFTVQGAADWWVNTVITVAKGVIAPGDMDGVFADGAGLGQTWPGVSAARADAWSKAHLNAINRMRTELHQLLPGSMVYGNGLSEYPQNPDHNLGLLPYVDGVCLEHFGAFEGVLPDGSLNATKMFEWTKLIAATVAAGKSVIVKGWIGPETGPIDGMGPSWPASKHLNRTHAGIAQAAADNLDFSLAIFLCTIDTNVRYSYGWWYDVTQGYIICDTCDTPAGWYPQFEHMLGEPSGPAVWSGLSCKREFASASVSVNLEDSSSAVIDWKGQ